MYITVSGGEIFPIPMVILPNSNIHPRVRITGSTQKDRNIPYKSRIVVCPGIELHFL